MAHDQKYHQMIDGKFYFNGKIKQIKNLTKIFNYFIETVDKIIVSETKCL